MVSQGELKGVDTRHSYPADIGSDSSGVSNEGGGACWSPHNGPCIPLLLQKRLKGQGERQLTVAIDDVGACWLTAVVHPCGCEQSA